MALSQMKGNEPVALNKMKGNEPVAFKLIERQMGLIQSKKT
jgi:hypothetical protein